MNTAAADRPDKKFYKGEEISYMPIELKGVLVLNSLTQASWCGSIMQTNGQPMTTAAAAQILNWNQWPKTTSKKEIKMQTEKFLRDNNIPEDQIKTIWRHDLTDKFSRVAAPPRLSGRKKITSKQIDLDPLEKEMLSHTAKKHFNIFRDPFTDDVQSSDDVFMSSEQHYIREAMHTTAKHGGFLAIIGESGSGKTTLRRDLLDRIRDDNIVAIQPRCIDKCRLTAGMICEAIIADMSHEGPRRSLEGKARQVETILTGSSRSGNAHVLVIEEAHDISVQTLKYLKRFWELEDGFKKLLAIILIGQPELKRKLDERQNYDAREVIRRCEIAELMPLNGDLENYLDLKFNRIKVDRKKIFSSDAYDAIRERLTLHRRGTDGVESMLYPLVVNNLVTKAMNLAASIGAKTVDSEIIKGI